MMSNFGLGQGFGPITAGGGGTPPVGASFTVVDQGDGTGATATIAGAAGYTNKVYVYSFAGDTLTLEDTFTRSGNGTIDLTLDAGRYFAVMANDDFFASTPAWFSVTAAAESLYGDLLAAVQTRLIALGLSNIGANVLLKKFTWYRDGITYPAAFVCPYNEQWPDAGTNARDDTGYGISIALAKVSNRNNDLAADNQVLAWRERVRKAFRSQRIVTGTAHYTTKVEPGPVFDTFSFDKQFDTTFITLRAWAREARS